jgi:predicted Fe-Mo cluster-binding NifX family protein
MKTALTVWGEWISPVFDSAQTLLVVEFENRSVVNRQLIPFDAEHPSVLAKMLKKQNVSVLICGAISEYPARVLENEALELIPFISGNANEVLNTLAKGKSIVPVFLMPGCRRRNLMRSKTGNGTNPPGSRCCQNGIGRKNTR